MAKRIPFLYGRKRCIFCERQPPEVKISKEHIFGDWLREMFPRDAATTHTYGEITWPTPRSGLTRPVVKMKGGQGHSGSKKVPVVCKSCNETWLSNSIEEAAKPLLIPLIGGDTILTINASMQRILSTWAAKTVMTAEHVNSKEAVIHQNERTWLKENLSPPVGWHVWIGTYSGAQWCNLGIFQHPGRLEIPSVDNLAPAEHNIELTLIGLGKLMVLVINSSWRHIWDILDRLGTPSAMCRIWPIVDEQISWPRWTILTDAEAEYFTTYLARVLEHPV